MEQNEEEKVEEKKDDKPKKYSKEEIESLNEKLTKAKDDIDS